MALSGYFRRISSMTDQQLRNEHRGVVVEECLKISGTSRDTTINVFQFLSERLIRLRTFSELSDLFAKTFTQLHLYAEEIFESEQSTKDDLEFVGFVLRCHKSAFENIAVAPEAQTDLVSIYESSLNMVGLVYKNHVSGKHNPDQMKVLVGEAQALQTIALSLFLDAEIPFLSTKTQLAHQLFHKVAHQLIELGSLPYDLDPKITADIWNCLVKLLIDNFALLEGDADIENTLIRTVEMFIKAVEQFFNHAAELPEDKFERQCKIGQFSVKKARILIEKFNVDYFPADLIYNLFIQCYEFNKVVPKEIASHVQQNISLDVFKLWNKANVDACMKCLPKFTHTSSGGHLMANWLLNQRINAHYEPKDKKRLLAEHGLALFTHIMDSFQTDSELLTENRTILKKIIIASGVLITAVEDQKVMQDLFMLFIRKMIQEESVQALVYCVQVQLLLLNFFSAKILNDAFNFYKDLALKFPIRSKSSLYMGLQSLCKASYGMLTTRYRDMFAMEDPARKYPQLWILCEMKKNEMKIQNLPYSKIELILMIKYFKWIKYQRGGENPILTLWQQLINSNYMQKPYDNYWCSLFICELIEYSITSCKVDISMQLELLSRLPTLASDIQLIIIEKIGVLVNMRGISLTTLGRIVANLLRIRTDDMNHHQKMKCVHELKISNSAVFNEVCKQVTSQVREDLETYLPVQRSEFNPDHICVNTSFSEDHGPTAKRMKMSNEPEFNRLQTILDDLLVIKQTGSQSAEKSKPEYRKILEKIRRTTMELL